MTQEQVDKEFGTIVDGLSHNQLVAEKLTELMDMVHEFEPWPDDEAPKIVSKLWM